MPFFERKQNRLKYYDYSESGAYFITVCVKNSKNILWDNSGLYSETIKLSSTGIIVDKAINNISVVYSNVKVEKYAVMPIHIHMILILTGYENGGRPMTAPTVSCVINQMKGYISKHLGEAIWQKSFHDHIIRNEQEYLEIWKYIDNNSSNWRDDCYFIDIT